MHLCIVILFMEAVLFPVTQVFFIFSAGTADIDKAGLTFTPQHAPYTDPMNFRANFNLGTESSCL